MKKLWMILGLCVSLCGCTAAQTFETLGQVEHEAAEAAAMATIQLTLPESASVEALHSGGDSYYECDGYSLSLLTLTAGDFSGTVQAISGFSPDRLTIMQTQQGAYKRYEWVWTAAGEEGALICRTAVLDDGNYHYCLCLMASAESAGALQAEWAEVIQSFCLN